MTFFGIFVVLVVLGLLIYGLQIAAVRLTFQPANNLESPSSPSKIIPPVSILKPLKGLEDSLMDNLESFCLLDYPEYEIIFSLQDENDPACKVARKVKEKFADKSISVITGKGFHGLNPKVNNLFSAYRLSRYPMVLISDSNVMVDPLYLRKIVESMEDPDVGLVCNLFKGVHGKTLGSTFENLHLNSFVLGNICLLNKFLKIPCVVGKSMLMRKTDLEAIGGLEAVKDLLAEDHFIGEKIRAQKQRVIISSHIINNVNEYWNLKKFINRHVRWGKIRWKIGGIKYFSELLINSVFISSLPLLLFGLKEKTAILFLSVCLIKISGDLYLGRFITRPIHSLCYILSPLKDLLIGLIWFVPLLDNTVVWRGNRYRISKYTRLSRHPEKRNKWEDRVIEGVDVKSAA